MVIAPTSTRKSVGMPLMWNDQKLIRRRTERKLTSYCASISPIKTKFETDSSKIFRSGIDSCDLVSKYQHLEFSREVIGTLIVRKHLHYCF